MHPVQLVLSPEERRGGEEGVDTEKRSLTFLLLLIFYNVRARMLVGSRLESSALAIVGVWTITELSLALVVLHVAANRSEASFAAKCPGLVVCTALTL